MTLRGRKCLNFNIFLSFCFGSPDVTAVDDVVFLPGKLPPAWSLLHEQVERPSQQLSAWAHYTFTWDGASVSMLSLWGCEVPKLGEEIAYFVPLELRLRLGDKLGTQTITFRLWTFIGSKVLLCVVSLEISEAMGIHLSHNIRIRLAQLKKNCFLT